MNRTLWKLDRIGERLWILATMIATQATIMAHEGKGIAVVAEETRRFGNRINDSVEKVITGEEELDKDAINALAFQLNLLALNCAIESSRIVGYAGKQTAVYAGEIRDLAYEIVCLLDESSATRKKQIISPWAADPSSVAHNGEFLLLHVGGITIVEALENIREIGCITEYDGSRILLRNMEIPLVDICKMLDDKQKTFTQVIVWTPWAEQNKTYAVTADVSNLFVSPIGKTIETPPDMPLAKYVRECWENENGEPFYFMDWTKMI